MGLRILITGANGFVGKPLCAKLIRCGYTVRAAVRTMSSPIENAEVEVVGSINSETDWTTALDNVDVVIHLAARVHVMNDDAVDPLDAFRSVNTSGAEHLARSAAAGGVKRLVFVSSIKVNGESTFPDSSALKAPAHSSHLLKRGTIKTVFREADDVCPQDPYGISKWEAELALHRIAQETGLEVVIVRPPLVYGEGVKGNFAQMLKILSKGIPLPLASVSNLRSLVYIGNFVDALLVCATHTMAAGKTYMVSDGEDVATPELLCKLGVALGRPARLFPCPPVLLRLAGRALGKSDQIERLQGSLQVDSSKIRRELGWRPPYTLQQGLQATAEWYLSCHN